MGGGKHYIDIADLWEYLQAPIVSTRTQLVRNHVTTACTDANKGNYVTLQLGCDTA